MKKLIALISVLLLSLLLCSCAAPKAAPIDAANAGAAAAKKMNTEMVQLFEEDVEDVIGITVSDCTAWYAAMAENNLQPEEILVFTAKDEATAREMLSTLKEYIARRVKESENYLPQNTAVIKAAIIEQSGNTVYSIVSANAKEVLKALQGR